jgi:hypothetical protein
LLQRGARIVIDPDILLAGLACGVGFLIGTPYSVLDLPAFLNGLAFEVRHYATVGDPGSEGQNAWLWYGGYLLRWEGVLPLLALGEGLRAALTKRRETWFFASLPLAALFLVSTYAVKNDRTAMAILPALAILAGAFLDGAIALLEQRTTRSLSWLLAAALLLAVLLRPARNALQVDLRFNQPDVRTQVTRWLEAHVPAGSHVVGEYYSPLLTDSALHFVWVDHAFDQPLEWYRQNADYLVLVENRYAGYLSDPQRYRSQVAAYESLFAAFERVQDLQGGALGNPCHAMVFRVQP